MSSSPTFSIVVPTHSRVDLFHETLASIETQSLKNFELIVSDDSPSLNDRRAIEAATIAFSQRSNTLARYIFTQPKLGQAANTNQGLKLASGKFVRILHSDDILAPNTLENEANILSNPSLNTNLLFHDVIAFNHEPIFRKSPQLSLISPKEYFIQALHSSTPVPSAIAFHRDLLKNSSFLRTDFHFLCDWDFFIQLLLSQVKQNNFIAKISQGFVAWRTHQNSTTGKHWNLHFLEHQCLMRELHKSSKDFNFPLFNNSNLQSFLKKALYYRYNRLLSDFAKIPLLRKSLALPKFLHCLLQPLSISQLFSLKAPKQQNSIPRQASLIGAYFSRYIFGLTKSFLINKKWKPQSTPSSSPNNISIPTNIEISAYNYASSTTPSTLSIHPSFDNSIHLHPIKNLIQSASSITFSDINSNRFVERSLHECLKFIPINKSVSFNTRDNNHLTHFGLKALIAKLFPNQFLWQSQTRLAHNAHSTQFKRVLDPNYHIHQPHTGWTFGMLTLGKKIDLLHAFVDSIENSCPSKYEIIFISPVAIPTIENRKNTRVIIFDINDHLGWITKKKNIIADEAQFSDILIAHDRFTLTPEFFQDFHKQGFAYGICAPKLISLDNQRLLDWAVVSSENLTYSYGGLLHYNDYSKYAYIPGGSTIIRKSFWQKFPWDENLFWNEHEDVELCRRIQRHGHILHLSNASLIAHEDRWISQNPHIPLDPHTQHLHGQPVAEQRLEFIPSSK